MAIPRSPIVIHCRPGHWIQGFRLLNHRDSVEDGCSTWILDVVRQLDKETSRTNLWDNATSPFSGPRGYWSRDLVLVNNHVTWWRVTPADLERCYEVHPAYCSRQREQKLTKGWKLGLRRIELDVALVFSQGLLHGNRHAAEALRLLGRCPASLDRSQP